MKLNEYYIILLVVFFVFIAFMLLDLIFPYMMTDTAGIILGALLILSGVIAGCSAWIVRSIKKQKS